MYIVIFLLLNIYILYLVISSKIKIQKLKKEKSHMLNEIIERDYEIIERDCEIKHLNEHIKNIRL
jgi:hypothetical protein